MKERTFPGIRAMLIVLLWVLTVIVAVNQTTLAQMPCEDDYFVHYVDDYDDASGSWGSAWVWMEGCVDYNQGGIITYFNWDFDFDLDENWYVDDITPYPPYSTPDSVAEGVLYHICPTDPMYGSCFYLDFGAGIDVPSSVWWAGL